MYTYIYIYIYMYIYMYMHTYTHTTYKVYTIRVCAHIPIRDRPRARKQTAPNLSIVQQTSNNEIAHCSTTCDRIMHVYGGWDVRST